MSEPAGADQGGRPDDARDPEDAAAAPPHDHVDLVATSGDEVHVIMDGGAADETDEQGDEYEPL